MKKKVLSIVLAAIMLMSVLVVGGYAATDWKRKVDVLILYEISHPEWNSAKLDEFLANDPDIIERNLYFWKDEIIEAYHAAETQADWQALYEDMTDEWLVSDEGYDLEWWYPEAYNPSKAVVDLKHGADVQYAKPGDVITVTSSMKTNFYFFELFDGIMFDKTLVTPVPGSLQVVPYTGRVVTTTKYDYGFTNLGTDYRKYDWPKPYRDNLNGEYDQYGIVRMGTMADVETVGKVIDDRYITKSIMLEELTPIFTVQFTVNEGVPEGTELNFFTPIEATPQFADIDNWLNNQAVYACSLDRAIGPDYYYYSDEIPTMDKTWNIENAKVIVGEPPVEGGDDLADCTGLEDAIDAFDETVAADYTADSWQDYADAVAAAEEVISQNPTADNQDIVDEAIEAIADAYAALEKNAIISANVVGEPVLGTNAYVDVTVTGSPEYLRFTSDTAVTFERDDAQIVDNGDGTETWTVTLFAGNPETDYEIFAKYATVTEEGFPLTVNAVEGLDLTIHSIVIPDMYPNQANGGRILKGKHDIIIETSTDVERIQFVDTAGRIEDGATYTYMTSYTSYVDEGNVRTWTISHSFGPLGSWSMPIRTRGEDTTYVYTGESLTATVLY